MFRFITVLSALLACAAARPGVLTSNAFAAGPAVAYANAPLYAPSGSNQIDVRHNYDGTLSSYTTAPFNYAGPYSSRYVAGPPGSFAAPASYASPAVAAAPSAFAAPAKYFAHSGVASPYAVPHGVQYSSPFAAQFSSPYASFATGPFGANAAA